MTERLQIRKPGRRAVAAGLGALLGVGLAGGCARPDSGDGLPMPATSAPSGIAGFGEGSADPTTTRPDIYDPTTQAVHPTHTPYRPTTAPRHTATTATAAPKPATITEYTDNSHGSPVFADEYGHPVSGGESSRIPFDTAVEVVCKRPNLSTMGSITAFYLIEGGTWGGDYVVADTMTNGGPRRDPSTPNLDPRVTDCPPR